MKIIFFSLFALAITTSVFGQSFDLPCDNFDYKKSVATVQLFADGNQNKEPLIPLDNPLYRLTLSFDLLGTEGAVLNYTFIHCSNDWLPTDIQRTSYASGFDYGRIDDFDFSRNTLVDYVHYQINFPDEDMFPLISGNYLLVVYDDDLREENMTWH